MKKILAEVDSVGQLLATPQSATERMSYAFDARFHVLVEVIDHTVRRLCTVPGDVCPTHLQNSI